MAGQKNASGPYLVALKRCAKVGPAHADDPALMASFCDGVLMQLVGAASPQLVWEGAQKKGLTTAELNKLCLDNPNAVHDLMWI